MTDTLPIRADDADRYSGALVQLISATATFADLAVSSFGIPDALGLSDEEWAQRRIREQVWKTRAERQALSVHLTTPEMEGGGGLSNYKAGELLGVDESTVRDDKRKAAGNPAEEAEVEQEEQVSESDKDPTAGNPAEPLWPPPVEDDETDPESESDTSDATDTEPTDAEPEPLKPADPGWHHLGDHLLYCGDSNDPEFIKACKGTFAFADPPYNAGKATWDEGFEWTHDYLAEAADIVAVTPGIAALKGFHTVTGMPYQWSVAAEVTNGMTRGALGFGNWIYVALFSSGSLYRNAKDYLRIPAHTSDDKGGEHAARKPLRLLTELIGLFTSKGDTVIDPFLGSGTTLIAAEKTGRRCIGAEIDPMHCADIIARYNAAVTS